MSGAHTPGPWAFDGISRIDALQFRKPAPDNPKYMQGLVALPYSCGETDDGQTNHTANALLMAAAPDLLTSLQNMVGLAEEAIALREQSQDPDDAEMLPVYRDQLAAARADIAKATGSAA